MFVDEDCIDSRSDVDDPRTRDCLYDERRPVRYDLVIILAGLLAKSHT